MDIRDALTDDYLAQFYDGATLVRARTCLTLVRDMVIAHETSTSLTVTAQVWGSAPSAYDVQFHAEVNKTSDWVFSACSCPVARMCKHGAAVALRLRGAMPARPQPQWRHRLAQVSGELEQRSRSTLTGTALGLEISHHHRTRWSRGTPGDFAMRPMRPGKRGGWVRSGADWTDLSGPVARSRFVPAQAEALLALHRGLVGRHTYLVAGAAPMLDDYGDRLVPGLRAAVEAGVTLLPGAGVDTISLLDPAACIRADLTARTDPGGTTEETVLDVFVEAGERRWRGDQVVPVGHPATSVVLVDGDAISLAELAEPVDSGLLELLIGPPLVVGATDLDSFLDALTPLTRHLDVVSSDGSRTVPAPARPVLQVTVTWHSATRAVLVWEWAYGSARCALTSGESLGGLRDLETERAIHDTVPAAIAGVSSVTGGDALSLALHDLPHLRSLADLTVLETSPPDFRESTRAPEIEFTLAPDQPDHTDWLDLEVRVSVDGEHVPLPDVLAAVTRQDEFLVLPSGLFVTLDRPEFARLHEVVALAAQLRDADDGRVSVGASDLSVWAELAELGVVDAQAASWVERATALRDLTEVPQPDPVGMATTLRPYQLEGFWWLAFLHEHGLGGILADDMGLGKTLQVLALIQHAVAGGAEDCFLVVAPTSVVTAWREQAVTHAPGLRVGIMSRRTDDVAALARDHDVLVTTYALLRLESDQFAARHWSGVVLDEAQQVKNHQSKAYAAVRILDADFRLAVTGTPFENRLMELWSLLSITAPGLYPAPRRFRDVVAGPVEKEGDQAALDRFRRRIRPFMLRRTKELVAADLPPKQEQVVAIDLGARHRKIYDTHLAKERQRILGLVDDFDHNRVAIFSALTKLRQLALDPALVDPEHDRVGSAKIDLLVDQLAEVTAEGHQALVFSTFTSFLGRVRDRLTAEGIATVYLDGSTRDRQTVIDAFRRGAAPVFLISLKAGGVGLTLTEADYVYVLDPWWNPAAEAQAVDRAHRIGQDKHVNVYRLVATDTIEEKVMALKARKAELFAKVIDGGGATAAGISAEDIRDLFI